MLLCPVFFKSVRQLLEKSPSLHISCGEGSLQEKLKCWVLDTNSYKSLSWTISLQSWKIRPEVLLELEHKGQNKTHTSGCWSLAKETLKSSALLIQAYRPTVIKEYTSMALFHNKTDKTCFANLGCEFKHLI